jgi:puromycin-sensitive aminopeptidase
MSDRDFRLPQHIRPTHHALHLDVDLDAWRFQGHEEITLAIGEPSRQIILHALDLEIASARAATANGELKAELEFNREAETAILTFPQPLATGACTLRLRFAGEILARLRGFYRSQKDGDRYAATQFEAADARRAFPCFDEPEFKARFALTLAIPAELTAIANGAVIAETPLGNGRKEVRFAETPPISSYLVAYTVGPYEATPVVHTPSGVPVRVYLPRGMADKGIYARDAHQRALAYLEEYTGIPYPYGKVDAIGVPDFEAGAMENPGAITYRLTAIAADGERASTAALKGIFYTAAHELTHMWWGDLVTMAWWDDLWLNESFATFIGYKVVADLVPEWGMWRDFVSTLSRPFSLDALVSTHPISFEVNNAKQATERFDVITYWKGAGVVRMIEGFLGADAFRRGVQSYLDRHRERNATADDFWRELTQSSGRDVGTIANAWIKQPGHPLISFTAAKEGRDLRLTLRQERFFTDSQASRTAAAQLWPVPLVIKYGTDAAPAEERVLLDGAETAVTLRDARWFFPNGNATGFYRFAVDEAALDQIIAVMPAALTAQERLSLVGNQWTLAKAGRVPIAQFLALLDGLRAETDRAVLGAVTERLDWINTHLVEEAARPRFEELIARFYGSQLEQLGWDPSTGEAADDRQRRAIVIGALGDLGRAGAVLAEARVRLERYLQDRASLDPNLVSTVVGLSAQRGDMALYERYRSCKRAAANDPEEEQRFLFGLTAFEDPALIERTLSLSLTDEVRPQDRAHVLARLLGERASRAAAWGFVREHWDQLTAQMDPMLQQNLIRALAQLTPKPIADSVHAFLRPRATDETRETVEQALEQLALDTATCIRLAPELSAWLQREQRPS